MITMLDLSFHLQGRLEAELVSRRLIMIQVNLVDLYGSRVYVSGIQNVKVFLAPVAAHAIKVLFIECNCNLDLEHLSSQNH